jgi:hypothetical protein
LSFFSANGLVRASTKPILTGRLRTEKFPSLVCRNISVFNLPVDRLVWIPDPGRWPRETKEVEKTDADYRRASGRKEAKAAQKADIGLCAPLRPTKPSNPPTWSGRNMEAEKSPSRGARGAQAMNPADSPLAGNEPRPPD